MRSASQLLVNRLQRCGLNMYDHFIIFVTYCRLLEFFVPRHGSYRVQDGCIHANSPFVPTDSHGRYATQHLADDEPQAFKCRKTLSQKCAENQLLTQGQSLSPFDAHRLANEQKLTGSFRSTVSI